MLRKKILRLTRTLVAAVWLLIFSLGLLASCATEPGERGGVVPASLTANPIILVHGFGGWGREDVPGFYYWGGFNDLELTLRKSGYQVFSAAVGPFSSNWDRACELFAFIKGGTVDYGESHARRYGHERFGARYPGVYPDWSEENKVHLIAHSMGGQTARLLAHLLRAGDQDEQATSGRDCQELFIGTGQWIRSITTLSTPHNGTTIINDISLIDLVIKGAIAAMASVTRSNFFPDFDLKIDHWGISRNRDEPLAEYFNRLRNHEVWSDGEHDFSLWDVSVAGAASLNERVRAEPDVYYFAWATEETTGGPLHGHQIPEITMLPLWMPSGLFLGSYGDEQQQGFGPAWWQNDGVVNTISMKGPFLNSSDTIVDFDSSPAPGEWNYMGLLSSIDHSDILGIPNGDQDTLGESESIADFYLHICRLISAL